MKNEANPAIWLEYAESDLELAKTGKTSKKIKYNTLCFHSQQAVEKSVKAVLVFHKIDFPKTHHIDFLFKILKKEKINVPEIILETKYLSKFSVDSRYPGEELEIEKSEYLESIKSATLVLKWAKSILNKSNKLF